MDHYPGTEASDEEIDAARAQALQEVLVDNSWLKVAVAGPGTGKTHTFQCFVDQTQGRVLILTFLTSLVDDLKLKLGEIAAVYSFHGFAKRQLHVCGAEGINTHFDYYPALETIFETDLRVTDHIGSKNEIADAIMNLKVDGPILPLVLRSGNYYNAVSHNDAVYRLLTTFLSQSDQIPEYSQLLVDEYQDFSLLEVEMIKSLSAKSPTLVVGDDDQALYLFRHASPRFIRALVAGEEFKNFVLPYCSRCTSVLVEATHCVVTAAQACGLLSERIVKPYLCYVPGKRADSESYPKIIHARCSVDNNRSPYMARYIAREIRRIPDDEIAESRRDGYPTVLIIGQRQFTNRIERHLSSEGFDVTRKGGGKLDLRGLDGYRRLMQDADSRLGWRILLEMHRPPGWEGWVTRALLEDEELVDLIDPQYRSRQLEVVELLRQLINSEVLSLDEQSRLEAATGLRVDQLLDEFTETVTEDDEEPEELEVVSEADTGPTVMITTLLGSKGLQAQRVFVVGVNEGSLPRDNAAVSEPEVCEMLVALTRARKSSTLVSCRNFAGQWMKESIFVRWLAHLLEERIVDREHLSHN